MKLYLTQALHRAVQQSPHAVATVYQGRTQTYAELHANVALLAGALRKLGVKPGDRVGMLALNSDRSLVFYLAVWWAGAVVNPVNTRWSVSEIVYSLDDCETHLLFVDDAFAPMCGELGVRSRALQTLVLMGEGMGEGAPPTAAHRWDDLLDAAEPVADVLRSGDDLAGVFYTGGTTGTPKGVMLSHQALVTNTLISLLAAPFGRAETLLHSAPLFHLAGLSFLLRGLAGACRQVILPGFTVDGAVQRTIAEERVTHVMMVPAMLQMLVDDPRTREADLSSVQWVGYGASPIAEGLLERAFAAFPRAEFVQGYGMTELSAGVSYLTAWHHTPAGRKSGKLASAGQALMGVDVRIVDAQGHELPRGSVGEIAVRSPCAMLGYWNQPQLSALALRGGWMHTGDAARMDGDGFIFIVDRFKDMVVSGGENVYCGEVENALSLHPAVAAVAVIGIPSEQWGEAVHAVVVRKAGAAHQQVEAADLLLHCHRLIAGYKCPRSVEFVDALPISGAGKVMKYKLREPHWAGRTRRVN